MSLVMHRRDKQDLHDRCGPKAGDPSSEHFSLQFFRPPHPSRFSRKSRDSHANNEIHFTNVEREIVSTWQDHWALPLTSWSVCRILPSVESHPRELVRVDPPIALFSARTGAGLYAFTVKDRAGPGR